VFLERDPGQLDASPQGDLEDADGQCVPVPREREGVQHQDRPGGRPPRPRVRQEDERDRPPHELGDQVGVLPKDGDVGQHTTEKGPAEKKGVRRPGANGSSGATTGVTTGTNIDYRASRTSTERDNTMDIADIATTEYVAVETDERLGKIRSIFDRENPKGLIVTEDEAYAGVLAQRQLVQSRIDDDAKVERLMQSAPKVDRTADVREVARVLVEGKTKIAPVFEADRLWGIVSEDDILEAVLENLDALTVGEIATDDVVTVDEDTHIGRVINLLRENDISRLPVLDEDGNLSGLVTTHDIVDVVVRDMDKTTRGDRGGGNDRVLDMPVYDIMSSPVETTTGEESVEAAVRGMLDSDYAGLVVTPEDDDRDVEGVVTKTDVLRALTYTEEEHMDVQITKISLLEALSREQVRQQIESVVDKYQEMQVRHAHVRFQEHKETHRGTPLIQAQIRLRTNEGQAAGSGEGYGADNAFRVALDKLERNVLELKGVRADEEYRGQLLRKLGEL